MKELTPEMLVERMIEAENGIGGMDEALRIVLQAIEDGEVVCVKWKGGFAYSGSEAVLKPDFANFLRGEK